MAGLLAAPVSAVNPHQPSADPDRTASWPSGVPTDDQLRRFLAGALPRDDAERVARWVEATPEAADILARLERVDTLAAAFPAEPPDDPSARIADGAPGRGRGADACGFELLGEIGRGGMGVVYRATDHALDRDVAVKLLQDRYARTPSPPAGSSRKPASPPSSSTPASRPSTSGACGRTAGRSWP